mmetsp:Transcript_24800/g.28380  ORF Transcript_24800/g.28380 Transcript_24800/m.28380 type:complete len:757 (+) Transcript_24800:42-2312(+)
MSDIDDNIVDGWDDDDVDELDFDDDVNADIGIDAQNENERDSRKGQILASSSSSSKDDVSFNEGWDWEDDNVDEDTSAGRHIISDHDRVMTTSNLNQPPPPPLPRPLSIPRPPAGPPPLPTTVTMTQEEQQLVKYINNLSLQQNTHLIQSINSIFISEKNNDPEAALELCRYYHSRPQLTPYTLDSEVPRMEYQIIISDDFILTHPEEIQQHFRNNPIDNLVDDMLLRSSNQSILADVFPVITGIDDSIVRMKFYATAVATNCRFVLDMRHENKTTQVDCTLLVSVPLSNHDEKYQKHSSSMEENTQDKLNLAKIRIMIHFSPEPSAPFVKYQLISIQPLLDAAIDQQKIRHVSQYLILLENDMNDNNNFNGNQDTSILRDDFLNSIMSNTHSGFKSALRDIDGVVNVSSKFNYIKNVLPILPSANDILMAAQEVEEEEAAAGKLEEKQKQARRNHDNKIPSTTNIIDTPMAHQKEIFHLHNGQNNHQLQQQQPQQAVPRPIIGGLLMSGISNLAKKVTVPTTSLGIPSTSSSSRHPTPPPPPPPQHSSSSIHTQQQQQRPPIKLYRNEKDENENIASRNQEEQQPRQKEIGEEEGIVSHSGTQLNDNSYIKGAKDGIRHHNIVTLSNSGDYYDGDNKDDINSNKEDGEGVNGWSDDDDDIFIDDEHYEDNISIENKVSTREFEVGVKDATMAAEEKQQQDQEKNCILLQKMQEIRKIEVNFDAFVPESFVYDDKTGIIPKRERFISRSQLLDLNV